MSKANRSGRAVTKSRHEGLFALAPGNWRYSCMHAGIRYGYSAVNQPSEEEGGCNVAKHSLPSLGWDLADSKGRTSGKS